MTTIAKCSIDDIHALASDGLCIEGSYTCGDNTRKLYSNTTDDDLVIGVGGDYKTINMIDDYVKDNKKETIQEFVRWLSLSFQQAGYKPIETPGKAPVYLQEILYMTSENVHIIGQDLSIIESSTVSAIGTGGELAVGAMLAMIRLGMSNSMDIAIQAVKIAAEKDVYTNDCIMVACRGKNAKLGPMWVEE